MKKYKYYGYINNYIGYDTAIIPGTYKEYKYIITFYASTMVGDIYYYFIDTFNESATMQKISHISVGNPIGCTSDFIELFKIIEDEEEKSHKNDNLNSSLLYSHILKRFNRGL